MQKALAIARREIAERSFVFITAVVLAVAPAIALIVPRGTFEERLTAFAVLSLIIAVGFTGGLSTILGVSLVGREMTEKRLSFYFARPLSGAQIWFGKVLGALALVAGCALIVFLPSAFFFPDVNKAWATFPLLTGFLIVAFGFLFAIGHLLSTLIRSRSVWLAADFAAAIVFKVCVAAMLMPLFIHNAHGLVGILISSVIIGFIATIIAGGAWQLTHGRVDARGNHRELSKFLWSAAGIALVAMFGYTTWVASAGPHDINYSYVDHAGNSSWVFASGPAKHRLDYESAFLYDVATGASIAVPTQFSWAGGFERTGGAAMWVQPVSPMSSIFGTMVGRGAGPMEIVVTKLAPDAKPVHTGIVVDRIPQFVDVTSDLSRLAIVSNGNVALYDVATRKSLGSAHVGRSASTRFESPDRLWIFDREQPSEHNWIVRIQKFDVASHSLTKVFETTARGNGAAIRLADDNRTVIVRTFGGTVAADHTPPPLQVPNASPALRMFDLTTGQELALPQASQSSNVRALKDGRLMIANGKNLEIYANNTLQSAIAIPTAKTFRIAGEVTPGIWVVAHEWGARESDIVDINKGQVIARGTGLSVLQNASGVPVFQDEKGTFLTWNWQTNERKAVF